MILKTAFSIYEQPGSNQRRGGITEWEIAITEELGIPRELVSQSRLENSGVSQSPKTMIFDPDMATTRHGLTALGIAVGQYIKE